MSVRKRGGGGYVILIRLLYHHYIEKPNRFLCIWRFCYNVYLHLYDKTFNMYTASTYIYSLSSADNKEVQQLGAEPTAMSAE